MLSAAWHAQEHAFSRQQPALHTPGAKPVAAAAAAAKHSEDHSVSSTDSEGEQAVVSSVLTRLRHESESRAAVSAQAAEALRQAAELNPTRTRGAHATIAAHSIEGESSRGV